MTLDYTGKVVIVTGAGGGLGRSHALEFARRGAKVVVNDLGGSVDGSGGSSEAADKVVEEIKAAGGEAISNGSSVTDDAGVANMVQQTMDAYGRIDALVNNAGVLRDKSFAKMEVGDFSFVVDVHLFGTMKPTKAVWPIMKEQGYGRILVTSSSSGLYGNFGQANYGAAKLGVVGLINTLKLEGQKDNIHVNALAPVAWTRMTSNLMPPEMEEALTPEQVTPAVVFMCSEQAPTGKIICAGAGAYAAAQIIETRGMYLGAQPSAEDVADNWEQISKLDDQAEALFQGGEQTRRFFELIQAANNE
ncbi:MAG: SDR family NAD(P)-dependent oxidoreductase [PS1 clade bacterium]|nr:SDR family NAD(P)-dependent oxidoreductase [PS1 clade bacterium]CAI8369471.1 MAG: Putative short-chain type dehydrogenase/reductase [Rhodobiaceae bacterium UBA7378]HCQ82733.1 3-oxoacyl-ACP reductase [Rhodobiaceae bacterium]|tara:strand:- start:1176 stop:2087 length:912 start_codon:yes stop_codon:yes gene_type:complete